MKYIKSQVIAEIGLTTGNVIHTGTMKSGITQMNLLIFRITVDVFVVVENYMFIILITPPRIGKIPIGSGALRSVNHHMPSVRIPGLIV